MGAPIGFDVLLGRSGHLEVALGAAPARWLKLLSFADVLDERADRGYQRPYDIGHARAFRAYIGTPGTTTLPLTFNLRGSTGWTLTRCGPGTLARLTIEQPAPGVSPVMAQVDGQHRLGEMADSDVPLAFQCFLGLSPRDEMAVFNVINSKARGLSSSILDYHATKLAPRMEDVQLDLYIAKTLNDDPTSVWHAKIKLGGAGTQGAHRRVSLRGLRTATREMLRRCPQGWTAGLSPLETYVIVRDYWSAVAATWCDAWQRPREHLLAKGVGVTALALLGGELITAVVKRGDRPGLPAFSVDLSAVADVDWRNDGPFKAFGGRHGAEQVHRELAARLWKVGPTLHRASGYED